VGGKRILEVGAGTGRDSVKLSQHGADVHTLDYSPESLRLIRSQLEKDEVSLILADALCSPLPDNSFDIVFHQGLLEHFTTPFPLLKENYRILKKGGLLLVDVPQTLHIYTLIKHKLMFFGLWFAGWERQFTVASLCRLLRNCGFEPVHVYGDWSRPGIFYKIVREIFRRVSITLPMYPRYFGKLTEKFYALQHRLRRKRIFLYTVLSIGVIARKI